MTPESIVDIGVCLSRDDGGGGQTRSMSRDERRNFFVMERKCLTDKWTRLDKALVSASGLEKDTLGKARAEIERSSKLLDEVESADGSFDPASVILARKEQLARDMARLQGYVFRRGGAADHETEARRYWESQEEWNYLDGLSRSYHEYVRGDRPAAKVDVRVDGEGSYPWEMTDVDLVVVKPPAGGSSEESKKKKTKEDVIGWESWLGWLFCWPHQWGERLVLVVKDKRVKGRQDGK